MKRERNHNLNVSKEELLNYLDKSSEQYIDSLDRLILEMNNIMSIIYSRQSSNLIDKISKDAFKNMESNFPREDNPFITSEMISSLAREISEKFAIYFIDTDES